MSQSTPLNARHVLLGAQASKMALPVCDHYSGVAARMQKSLQLQQEIAAEFGGTCVFDVTLDCEDGSPVGGEAEHAHLVSELAQNADAKMRVAARIHAVDHPAFESDVEIIAGKAAKHLCHIMVPKVDSVADVDHAAKVLAAFGAADVSLHVLVESPLAVHNAFAIAAHERVESISFGLMDFVSAHGGAIGANGMTAQGQFEHPMAVRAKLEIAAACHANGKTPSHCVVTEFSDPVKIENAARRASSELSYTRMWSIHPSQIRPILKAFAPDEASIDAALAIVEAAHAVQWAPISHDGVLHDRASYRFYWHVLERAYRTGQQLPEFVRNWLVDVVIRQLLIT